MLKNADLKTFLDHYDAAKALMGVLPAETTGSVVMSADGTIFSAELSTLYKSLSISSAMGDCDYEAAETVRTILRQKGDLKFLDFTHSEEWRAAIVWAIRQHENSGESKSDIYRRQKAVGDACARLRRRGKKITVEAYGVNLNENSKRDLISQIEGLVALIGGHNVVNQSLGIMRQNKLIHDGMWLFGDRVPGFQDAGRPATPFAWLLSLGMKHLGSAPAARKPNVAWGTLVGLSTDFAATFDCQRYGQFEEMDLHPSDFHRVASSSLLWREIFSLPQVPPAVLPIIVSVIKEILTDKDRAALGGDFFSMQTEILKLIKDVPSDAAVRIGVRDAEMAFPTLWRIARGKLGEANPDYSDPTQAKSRNQDSYLIFEMTPDEALILPSSFTTSATCEFIFRTIWAKLPKKRAEEVVGLAFEVAIARACEGKAPIIVTKQNYKVGKNIYEIDAATRDDDRIVLFETKAKSLTANARSGDQTSFFADFADSYLAMLEQLARHEDHLTQGLTPITTVGEDVESFRPLKVAVSPLSYGPVTDKVLAGAIVRAIIRGKFEAKIRDRKLEKAIDKFNTAVAAVSEILLKLSPTDLDGLKDLHSYLIDVFWVDLGQLIYVLNRSSNTWDAFRPLKHMTYSTRDFWTEVAYADRQGQSAGRWTPVSS